jgi:hypothetical protein
VGKAKACPPLSKNEIVEKLVGTAPRAFAHPTKPESFLDFPVIASVATQSI